MNPNFSGARDISDQRVDGRPYIKQVAISSAPPSGGDTYIKGETVQVSLSFDQAVETSGEVTVRLLLDGGRIGDKEVDAVYESGNESETLVFGYEVGGSDEDGNGIAVVAGSETSGFGGSGTIRAAGTTVAFNPTHPGLADADRHKVDGVAPFVEAFALLSDKGEGEVYTRGDWLGVLIIWSEEVLVVGSPQLELDFDGVPKTATYGVVRDGLPALSPIVLLVGYYVALGDQDADGYAIGPNKLSLNGGSIKDRGGNDALLSHPGVGPNAVGTVRAPNRAAAFAADNNPMRTVAENTAAGSNIGGRIAATDAENDSLTYLMSGDDAAAFELDPSTGQLRTRLPLDHEAQGRYAFTVMVHDGKDSYNDASSAASTEIDDTIDMTVEVTNVNEPPIITGDASPSLEEGGTLLVGTYRASDPEDAIIAWQPLGGADGGKFEFNVTNGRLSFKAAPDFEDATRGGDNEYTVTLGASAGGQTTTLEIAVTVTNVNEPPAVSGEAQVSIEENSSDSVGRYRATDPEEQTTTWAALSGPDAGWFAFTDSGELRELRFKEAPDFEARADANHDNRYEVTVGASDGRLSGRLDVIVTVTNVNEPPIITGDASPSLEAGGTLLVGTYRASDPEGATIAWQPLGGADGGKFEFTSSNGRLEFKAAPDYEDAERGGDNEYSVTLGVSAGGDTTTLDVEVTVTNKEEPAPRHVSTVWPTQTSITLDWSTVETAAEYKLEYRKDGESGWTRISGGFDHLPSTTDHRQAFGVAAGLDCETDYHFRVSARSSGDTRNDGSRYPSVSFGSHATTSAQTGECAQEERVTNLLVSVEPGCAILTWTPPSGDRDTGYRVERYTYTANRSQRSEPETLVEQASRVANRYQDCSDAYRMEGAEHVYIVSPLDDGGEALAVLDDQGEETGKLGTAYTSILVFGPSREPEGPRNVRLTHDTQSSRELAWDAPRDPWLTTVKTARAGSGPQQVVTDPWTTGYRVERREYLRTEGGGWVLPEFDQEVSVQLVERERFEWDTVRDETDGDTRTSFTDSEDKGDRQYVYRAWAYNDRGLSLYSWRGDWAFNGGDPGGDPEPAEYIPPPPAQQQGGETPSNTPPTGLPAISGTPQVDQTLTADTSGVTDEDGLNDVTYRYQWVAGGSDISGATGSTYTLTSSEEGQTIRVRVTFTDDSDNQESLTSAATGEVTAKPAALTASLPKSRFQSPRHLGAGDRPQVIVALSLPVASFEKTTPSVSLTGAAVSSVRRHEEDRLENAWIFFLDPDGNDAIVFRLVTGQPCDSGGICTGDGRMLTAAPEPRVLPGPEQQTEPENSAPTGLPTINGTPRVGETLTASTAGIADADGLTGVTFTYQWVSNGGMVATDIAGATNATYTLGAAEAGKTLTVRVTFTDDGGTQETLVSAATDPVPLPLTAAFEALPSEHDGSSIFTFRLRFSEDPAVSYTVLRDESFDVTGGTVKQVRRVNGRHDLREIHIQPTGNDDVFVRLAGGRACGTTGALCTADQRRLANSVAMRILGPLTGAEADATLSGQDSADVLYGSHGADTLDGGAGDDVLDGGPGTDSLMGGAGADTFVFAPGHGTDTLSDFSPEEEDWMDLTAFSTLTGVTALSLTADGTDTVLDLSAHQGGTVRLEAIAPADLAAEDFELP